MKNCFLKEKLYILLPMLTLFCLAGFIGSLIFPNEVLDTNTANMEESEEDFYLPMEQEGHVTRIDYEMTTEARPLKGIQIGIHKNGGQLNGTGLKYCVYVKEAGQEKYDLVSENVYELGSQAYDFQYVYLPFSHSEKCRGQIRVTFELEPGEGGSLKEVPSLRANKNVLEDTVTGYTEGDSRTILEGGLMISYIYSHDTYPFLYDFRILTFVFLAASMTLSYEKLWQKRPWQKKGGVSYEK
ncbi:MAG: hypothetical protein HDR01_14405 [Lachnospiraceae bacterium]|nr:hypothetical protein [Lachnospiraceae bacterium]